MEALLAALADPARWRLVSLLAERPRPVGVLARLAEARQPQTTKHLQALERAGVVTSERIGQRRVYALRSAPCGSWRPSSPGSPTARTGPAARARPTSAMGSASTRSGARRERQGGPTAARSGSTASCRGARTWSGATWSKPPCSPAGGRPTTSGSPSSSSRPGRAAGSSRSTATSRTPTAPARSCGRAEGVVEDVRPGERLAYRLSPLRPGGGTAFTAHVELGLRPTGTDPGTGLDVHWRITDSTVDSADFVAGIETGFGQSLDKLAAALTAADDGRRRRQPPTTATDH